MKQPFLIFALLSTQLLFAQRTDLSTLYRTNWSILNPAATNHFYLLDKHHNTAITITGRGQRKGGIEAAPVSGNISLEKTLLHAQHNPQSIRYGGGIDYNKAGAFSDIYAYGNFTYYLVRNRGRELSAGINLGWRNFRFNLFHESININPAHVDALFSYLGEENNLQQSRLNVGAGLFYRNTDIGYRIGSYYKKLIPDWYIGLSIAPQLSDFALNNSNYDFNRNMELHSIMGAKIRVTKKYGTYISLEPTLWLRYAMNNTFSQQLLLGTSPISADLNINMNLNDRFWLGGGVNTANILHLEVSAIPQKKCNNCREPLLHIGLAYDIISFGKRNVNPLGKMLEFSLGLSLE